MKRMTGIDKSIVFGTIVCLLPIILSIVLYDKLPNSIPIHWNINGVADNYAPKFLGAFGLPVIMALINLFVGIVMEYDPKKSNYSIALKKIMVWIIPIITVILMPITLFKSLGIDIDLNIILPIIIGVLFLMIGNYLPKCKQNFTMGIKLPWTLASEENWNKTHHVAGYIWMFSGLAYIISSFLSIKIVELIIGLILLDVIVPIIYSFYLYKKGI